MIGSNGQVFGQRAVARPSQRQSNVNHPPGLLMVSARSYDPEIEMRDWIGDEQSDHAAAQNVAWIMMGARKAGP
jgi:hypothetical protein